jgi:hypothetical protein
MSTFSTEKLHKIQKKEKEIKKQEDNAADCG